MFQIQILFLFAELVLSDNVLCDLTPLSCMDQCVLNSDPPTTVCYIQLTGCTQYQQGTCQTLSCDKTKCLTCAQPACTQCSTDYLLQNAYCYSKIVDCAQQSQATCTSCAESKTLVNSGAMCATLINNCLSYETTTTCKECKSGFHLSTTKSNCYTNIANCSLHTDQICSTCVDGYTVYNNDSSSICYVNIDNCQSTSYKPLTQKTYCTACSSGYTLTQDERCKLIANNCALYSYNLSKCIKCSTGYTLISDSQCSGCTTPIQYCLACQESSLFGLQCIQCQTGFELGPNQQSCLALCQSTIPYCISCSNSKCQTCATGYYINESGLCQSCQNKFANCDTCAINQCTQCSIGYYYDSTNKYCYKCSTAITGCDVCLDGSTCQTCSSIGYIQQNNKCVTCGSSIENCSTCQQSASEILCTNCLSGYVQASENGKNYCLSCIKQFNLTNCLNCQIAPLQCTACIEGYYLDKGTLTCLSCPQYCTKCSDYSTCTGCVSDKILNQSSQCTADISSFSLTGTIDSASALAYGNIIVEQKSLGSQYQIGTLNSKGYFCQSDKNCNMLGRCLLTECSCIKDITGSRCQFNKNDDLSSFHSNIISYLNSQALIDQNLINLMKLISDTSFSITETNVQSFYLLLSNSISQAFNSDYFTIIGNLVKNIQSKDTIASQKLLNIDSLNLQVVNKQAESLLISQTNTTTGPYHKQVISKYDLMDPDSESKFKSQFINSIPSCDNEKKFLSPEIYFTATLLTKLKELQNSASTPLVINQMHLYYNPYRSSGLAINSSISRVQFIKSGAIVNITSIEGIVIVPKLDQFFSDVNEQNDCVVWSPEKQIWESTSATLQRCRYYTVCNVTHYSDFGTYIKVTSTKTTIKPTLSSYLQTDFEIRLAVQNCAFALSCSLIGLFIVLTVAFVVAHKLNLKRRRGSRINTHDSRLHLESVPDTERAQTIRQAKKIKVKNFWTVYPLNAIIQTESLDYQMQKMSLFLLQIQMYVTFTSVYLAIEPFSFGRLTAYYILAIVQTWVTNYIFGGLGIAFRRKSKKQVFGCYWLMYVIIFFGMMMIGIWRMYGLSFRFDMYLLVGVGIEFVLDGIFCDLFVTYLYESLFLEDAFGIWKIIKYRGYFE